MFAFVRVNPPAQLLTIIFIFPLVVFNSLPSVKSSSQTDRTRQHNNTKEFLVLFGAYGLPSLFTIFMKVVSNSLLRRQGATPNPQPVRRDTYAAWDFRSYLFPSDIISLLCSVPCLQPVSWLPVHSL